LFYSNVIRHICPVISSSRNCPGGGVLDCPPVP
uniref:Clip domain-containing protein n=1 Tax=Brugia timori TaxID=42155 RepID=A0A0R3QRN5_9BILA